MQGSSTTQTPRPKAMMHFGMDAVSASCSCVSPVSALVELFSDLTPHAIARPTGPTEEWVSGPACVVTEHGGKVLDNPCHPFLAASMGAPWNHPAVATDAKTNWHRRLLRKHSPLEEAGWGGARRMYCFVPIPSDVTLFVPLPLSAPTESAEIRHGGSAVRTTKVEGLYDSKMTSSLGSRAARQMLSIVRTGT